MNSFICLILLGLAASVSGRSEPSPQGQGKSIFILAGQSNMAGRGKLEEFVDSPARQPHPNILRFNVERKWEEARDPLHFDIDCLEKKYAGVGPGMPFANRILEKNPKFGVIGLVPCAIGQRSLDEWGKGLILYKNMTERAQASLAEGGTIRALLWYQGEADASHKYASQYTAKFEKWISDVRTDLQLPNLPVIQVALKIPQDAPEIEIRRAQFAVNSTNVKTVDGRGLGSNPQPDQIHCNTESQIKVGTMMADTFLQFFSS